MCRGAPSQIRAKMVSKKAEFLAFFPYQKIQYVTRGPSQIRVKIFKMLISLLISTFRLIPWNKGFLPGYADYQLFVYSISDQIKNFDFFLLFCNNLGILCFYQIFDKENSLKVQFSFLPEIERGPLDTHWIFWWGKKAKFFWQILVKKVRKKG